MSCPDEGPSARQALVSPSPNPRLPAFWMPGLMFATGVSAGFITDIIYQSQVALGDPLPSLGTHGETEAKEGSVLFFVR